MAFPSTDLTILLRAAFGADPAGDPDDWVWTDISSRLLRTEAIVTKDGRAPLAANAEPGTASFILDGNDGDMVPLNPHSEFYPDVKLDLPMQIQVTGEFIGDIASGFVDEINPIFTPTTDGVKCEVQVSISGVVGRLVKGKSQPHSPLYRTQLGAGPLIYYPCEEASEAAAFSTPTPGGLPVTIPPGVAPGESSDLAGSGPLPTWPVASAVLFPVPGYASTGQWIARWPVNVPAVPPGGAGYLARFAGSGTVARWALTLEPGSPDSLALRGYDSSDAEIVTAIVGLDSGDLSSVDDFYGHDFMLAVAVYQSGGNIVGQLTAVRADGLQLAVDSGSIAGTATALQGDVVLASVIDDQVMGHFSVVVDPAFDIAAYMADAAADNSSKAMHGFDAEPASDRVARVCAEMGVRVEIVAGDSVPMGPQPVDTELNILQECERTDMAILAEKNFGLLWIPQVARRNPSVALTIDLATYATRRGTQRAVLHPAYDARQLVDEWTIDKPTGSQAVVGPLTGTATHPDSRQINPRDDGYLAQFGSLLRSQTTLEAFRWASQPIDLGANPALISAWLSVVPGVDRIVRTGAPVAFVSEPIDDIVYGRTQRIMPKSWTVTYSGAPARHWIAAVEGDDVLGKADTDGSVLTAAVTSGATTMLVGTTTGTSPLWTTDGGEMPLPLLVGGEVVSATAVATPTTITFGAAGTVTHASNASVTPGIPASVAAGNLLLVLAAIRNSGTGVPDVPSGYTRMAVFPESSNVQLFGKVAVGGDAAPTVTFTGGVANATTSAQMCRIAGAYSAPDEALVVSNAQLNASAQDIDYPALAVRIPNLGVDNCIVLYLGWKQDDWTSVASPGTEIGEPDTTTGDDQGIVWAYTIQTSAANIAAGSFVVTGGASAISRSAVCAIRSNVQSMTVTRAVNGVAKAQLARESIRLTPGAVAAL